MLVLALCGVLALLGATATALAGAAVARHRAASAADLAALAAAQRARLSPGDACAAAARAAHAAGAALERCDVTGAVAEVWVAVRPPGRLGELGAAHGRARAGPGEHAGDVLPAGPARPAPSAR